MLDAVYVDAKEERRIVGIKPKPPFKPIFQVATTKEGSGVLLMKEPPASQPEARCFWWRRGRVDLSLKQDISLWVVSSLPARESATVLVAAAWGSGAREGGVAVHWEKAAQAIVAPPNLPAEVAAAWRH